MGYKLEWKFMFLLGLPWGGVVGAKCLVDVFWVGGVVGLHSLGSPWVGVVAGVHPLGLL